KRKKNRDKAPLCAGNSKSQTRRKQRREEGDDMTAFAEWQNFYVIVGSSAGALIGLQFVVITLIADMPIGQGAAQAGHAFATPTIVHFGAVLLLAAMLRPLGTGLHLLQFCGA